VEVNQSIDFLYYTLSYTVAIKMQALEYDDGPLVWVCPLYTRTHPPSHLALRESQVGRDDLTSRSTVR
jgi:hypothetical protein